MAITTIIREIKQIHPKDVCMIKIGSFYHVYGRDAYILSYMFNYKLKTIEEKTVTCGFPLDSISKVMAKLEEKKINYLTFDRRNNYDEDEKSENGNLNQYDKLYEKAQRYIKLKNRIDGIYNSLMEEIENQEIKNKIISIEEIVYDRRKI